MTLCDDSHREIAFDGGQCPLCLQMSHQDALRYLVADIEGHVLTLLDELEG